MRPAARPPPSARRLLPRLARTRMRLCCWLAVTAGCRRRHEQGRRKCRAGAAARGCRPQLPPRCRLLPAAPGTAVQACAQLQAARASAVPGVAPGPPARFGGGGGRGAWLGCVGRAATRLPVAPLRPPLPPGLPQAQSARQPPCPVQWCARGASKPGGVGCVRVPPPPPPTPGSGRPGPAPGPAAARRRRHPPGASAWLARPAARPAA